MSALRRMQKSILDENTNLKISPELSEMTNRFTYRWHLKRRDFEKAKDVKQSLVLARKNATFPWIANLTFYLKLKFDLKCGYHVELYHDFQKKCRHFQDLRLEYAFVTTENRMFSLGPSESFQFDIESLRLDNFMGNPEFSTDSSGILTIHCCICVKSSVKLSEESGEGENCFYSILSPCNGHEEGLEVQCKASIENDEESEILNRYRFSGEIPDLNADKAIKLYLRCHNSLSRFNELTAICMEYLLYNLSPENVIGILTFSHKYELEELTTKCIDFLSRKCKVINV